MIINAIIENNYPKCPYCENSSVKSLKIIEADVATIDDETYFEMIMKCKVCGRESVYFLNTEMNKRITIDKSSERYKKVNADG